MFYDEKGRSTSGGVIDGHIARVIAQNGGENDARREIRHASPNLETVANEDCTFCNLSLEFRGVVNRKRGLLEAVISCVAGSRNSWIFVCEGNIKPEEQQIKEKRYGERMRTWSDRRAPTVRSSRLR